MIQMNSLNIGGLVVSTPIIQGGMGVGISLSGLAAAVANEGGVGVISVAGLGMLYKDASAGFLAKSITGLREEIRKARSLSSGILGVNIMVALTNFDDMVRTSIEEGIDVIICGAGLPLDLPKYLYPGCKTKLVPIVSSARAATLIFNKWLNNFNYLPDAVVVEGPKAGGHLGFKLEQIFDKKYALEKLIPEVVTAVEVFETEHGKKIPVIAAGGIFTGGDIAQIMKLGASGVQMGTRFVTTDECDASLAFKQAYLNASKEDVKIIKSPVGMPGRAIASPFLAEVEAGKRQPKTCPVNCIHSCDIKTAPYCIIASLTSAHRGNFNRGYAFAGSNVWRCNSIVSVKQLMNSLRNEYQSHLEKEAKGGISQNWRKSAFDKAKTLKINYIQELLPTIEQMNARWMRCSFPFIGIPILIQ